MQVACCGWRFAHPTIERKRAPRAIRRPRHRRHRLANSQDPGRRHPRGRIAVDGGRIVAALRRPLYGARLRRQAPHRRPRHRGDAGLCRLSSALILSAVARARGRIERPVVPVRPHVPLRGGARRRGRAGVGVACGDRALTPRRHVLGRSCTHASRGVGRRRDGDRYPHDRVAPSSGSPSRRSASAPGAHDRDHRRRHGARARCSNATPTPAKRPTIRGSAPAPRSAASTTPPTRSLPAGSSLRIRAAVSL